ncbi:MAG: HNH endonuclease, partial [Verrucomicrobiota bacterium]
TGTSRSKKAGSYTRALNMLGEILAASHNPFQHISNLWEENSIDVVGELYQYVVEQQKSGGLFQTDHAPSYWQSGFYSAALKSYRLFLVEHQYRSKLLLQYEEADSSCFDPSQMDTELEQGDLIEESDDEAYRGKDVIRQVKTRIGQSAFRSRVLENYRNRCCITGLNIPQLNRASHIVPWADSEASRLDPANGLCLSATFDLAFDGYWLTLDPDLCVVLSKQLVQYFDNPDTRALFERYEGKRIKLPQDFLPKDDYLEVHRRRLR